MVQSKQAWGPLWTVNVPRLSSGTSDPLDSKGLWQFCFSGSVLHSTHSSHSWLGPTPLHSNCCPGQPLHYNGTFNMLQSPLLLRLSSPMASLWGPKPSHTGPSLKCSLWPLHVLKTSSTRETLICYQIQLPGQSTALTPSGPQLLLCTDPEETLPEDLIFMVLVSS